MVSLNPFWTRHEARMMAALRQSFAVIEFSPTGEILAANDLFLKTMGYSAAEIKGQHHRLFVAPDYAGTQAYADFWLALGRGSFDTGEYRRFASGGREVWLQASYTPVRAYNGKVLKIIKLALDITAAHAKVAEDLGKLDALGRVQAVIEFKPDGTILTTNANCLNCVGYRLAAASQNLAREAGEITQMLSRFDTGKTARAPAPRTPACQPARVPELV
jgi:methyl-accepting chemotaxis protein